MVEQDIEITLEEIHRLDEHFNIVEEFDLMINRHSILLELPSEIFNEIGENLKPLKDYFIRARELGYSIRVEQIGEAIDGPYVITNVTFSHPGLSGLLGRDRENELKEAS